uniref:Fibronectin type-III domain-containing protein n=2 Tax=Arion vulgaris TaxID=1028688 RepID=A0A0B7AWJ5_9EUPU
MIKNYRLQVLDGGPDGYNLLTTKFPPSSKTLNLKYIQSNTRYHVIVEALTEDDSVLMKTSLTFQTVSTNEYGVSVYSSSSNITAPIYDPGYVQHNEVPTLDLFIQPTGASSTGLSWELKNIPQAALGGYSLSVRNNDQNGRVLLQEKMPFNTNYFKLDGLSRDRSYYLDLEALTYGGGLTFVRASTIYTPGRSVTPLHVKSIYQSSEKEEVNVEDNNNKPEIDLELTPDGIDKVKLNWKVVGGDNSQPIVSYRVKVHDDGPDGRLLLEQPLGLNTLYYTVSGLQEQRKYYIHLDALDRQGRVIEYVSSPYLVPRRGQFVESFVVSSTFKEKQTAPTPEQRSKREANNGDLVISQARAQGDNSIDVQWYDISSEGGVPKRETIVRYVEFSSNNPGSIQIQTVPAGQQRLILTKLKPATTYGLQVGSIATSGQYSRWSNTVVTKTGGS